MPNAVNLWSFLKKETKSELKKLTNQIGTDLIYVRHSAYYERRNSWLKRRYLKLKRETSMTKEAIYDQIAREIPKKFGTITAKAVQHVILTSADSRNRSTISGGQCSVQKCIL